MKIGFFTDTYFPQVSGVATSIKTLKEELEAAGHQVYIFTTTDPHVDVDEEDHVFRMPSIPFVSFTDRRIVVSGMIDAYQIAKKLELDLIHTHTEFGAGWLGKIIAKHLDIPVIHTYHTMYEDYLHYIAHGKLIKPTHVKQAMKLFCKQLSGVICPSSRVVETLEKYEITTPKRVIPTGINIKQYHQIMPETTNLRKELNIPKKAKLLLSLSRLSYEKNIQEVINGLPAIVAAYPDTYLVVVGDGPYKEELEKLATALSVSKHVIFTGEINHEKVASYYQSADYFVNASTSESQGLTYIEALASGVQCVVKSSQYLQQLFDHPSLGALYTETETFSQCFIQYVKQNHPYSEKIQQQKLYEISSECFAKRVLDFYEECYTSYVKNESDKNSHSKTSDLKVRFFRK